MSTHAQVVIAAPHRHLSLVSQRRGEVVGHGEHLGQAVHRLKHAVRVVAFFLLYLLLEEVVVLEG